jgi:uncharacterized membrane protein
MFAFLFLEIEMVTYIAMGSAKTEMPAGHAEPRSPVVKGTNRRRPCAFSVTPIYNGLYSEVLMSLIRYLMLLSLVIWIGGLIFFAFVLAPTVFAVLPTRQLAGNVVNRSLGIMHWMAIACGSVFAVASMIDARIVSGVANPFAARNLLIYAMIILTLVGMFGIASRMLVLRQQMGVIDNVPQDDARRVEFNRLHAWSERVEGSVLALGLVLLYLTARRMA